MTISLGSHPSYMPLNNQCYIHIGDGVHLMECLFDIMDKIQDTGGFVGVSQHGENFGWYHQSGGRRGRVCGVLNGEREREREGIVPHCWFMCRVGVNPNIILVRGRWVGGFHRRLDPLLNVRCQWFNGTLFAIILGTIPPTPDIHWWVCVQ